MKQIALALSLISISFLCAQAQSGSQQNGPPVFTCNGGAFTHTMEIHPANPAIGDYVTVISTITCIGSTNGGDVGINMYHRVEHPDGSLEAAFAMKAIRLRPGQSWHPSDAFQFGCYGTPAGKWSIVSNVRPDTVTAGCESQYNESSFQLGPSSICPGN